MTDTKISALPAVTVPVGTDEFVVNQGGTSKKVSLALINQYCEPLSAASTAAFSPAAATDTYMPGSAIIVPTTRLTAGTMYRLRMMVSKTAAGTAAPVFTVRYGTAGTTADTSRAALTMGAQTATAVTQTMMELLVTYRVVGASGVIVASIGGSVAGFPTVGATATSATFDTTPANSKIGVSINTGASAAWTFSIIQSDLLNIL